MSEKHTVKASLGVMTVDYGGDLSASTTNNAGFCEGRERKTRTIQSSMSQYT